MAYGRELLNVLDSFIRVPTTMCNAIYFPNFSLAFFFCDIIFHSFFDKSPCFVMRGSFYSNSHILVIIIVSVAN